MPYVNGEDLTPEQALEKDLCPECGRPLAETNPGEHVAAHWPRGAQGEGSRREKMILDWGAAHPKDKPVEEKK